jgi:hypothetical protein
MEPFTTPKASQLKLVSAQLPHRFAMGTQVCEFDGYCPKCQQKIASDMIRGFLIETSKSTIEIRALGYCQACKGYSQFNYQINDDLTYQSIDEHPRLKKLVSNLIPFLVGVGTFAYLYYHY